MKRKEERVVMKTRADAYAEAVRIYAERPGAIALTTEPAMVVTFSDGSVVTVEWTKEEASK